VSATTTNLAEALCRAGRRFDARGWVLGTSGNFSVVAQRQPLRLLITPSATFKGELEPSEILEIDDRALATSPGAARPSAEALLHVEIVRARGAGAVLHTHSIWSTLLSGAPGADGLAIEGFEMLKGLEGVRTHEHREWLPIVDNDQDMSRLAPIVRDALDRHPQAHGFLIRRHGLYTWGADLRQAVRHVEILEFLFEAIGRERAREQEHHHGRNQDSV
jgi:methylthioribulose-1-phosphate dehydratase